VRARNDKIIRLLSGELEEGPLGPLGRLRDHQVGLG